MLFYLEIFANTLIITVKQTTNEHFMSIKKIRQATHPTREVLVIKDL